MFFLLTEWLEVRRGEMRSSGAEAWDFAWFMCGLKSLRENFPIVPSLRDSICVKSFPALPCRATDCPVPSGLIALGDLRFCSTP